MLCLVEPLRAVQPAGEAEHAVEGLRAPGTVVGAVTHTAIPASRSASRSDSRFSSAFARTTSGPSPTTARTSGDFVPETRVTTSSGGWLHQSVAPTSSPGAVTATDSVSDGTSETTRSTLAGTTT